MTLTIRPATEKDLVAAIRLLEFAALPVADLSQEKLALVAEKNNKYQGIIGVEAFGRIALLRSLVVSPKARGAGIGPALVAALETDCFADGIDEVWLLTIDAGSFFANLGYVIRDRADAPGAIGQTPEFSGLCPSDAVLMSKNLS